MIKVEEKIRYLDNLLEEQIKVEVNIFKIPKFNQKIEKILL